MSRPWVVYVRRSFVKAGSPDVSDEAQEQAARAIIPPGVAVDVIADSGGHHSGRNDRRDGYQALIARLEAGDVAGVAVYDLSRLARSARLMHNLAEVLERRGVPLAVSNMPTTRWDTATGRFMFGQLALAAQFQADVDSERMRGITRTLFEEGRHRGRDPFGYRSVRDEERRRQLVIVPEQAELVRRIWRELGHRSFEEIAALLTRETSRTWTRDAVKDVVRRGRVYLGFVVAGRGLDERPGRHEPILDEATYAAGLAGMAQRRSGAIHRAPVRRAYLLAGVLVCGSCRRRMTGQTQVSRGREWRYYICRHHCGEPSVLGDQAEAAVLERIATGVLPATVVEQARDELRRRLSAGPAEPLDAVRRRRLEARLVQLRKQHSWREIDDADFRAEMQATRDELAALPDPDKLVLFDRNRRVMVTLAENLERATLEQRAELVRLLVARIASRDRGVAIEAIEWTGPAAPFFVGGITVAPLEGSGPPRVLEPDVLRAYA